MVLRALVAFGALLGFSAAGVADTITFKDGTEKTVRIYKMTKDYVSYLSEGKIEIVSRDKVKATKVEGEPISDKELAEAIERSRAEMKSKLKDEEAKAGLKPAASPDVKTVTETGDPAKGVKVIDKDKSKTKTTELMIDPFPDHPVIDKKTGKPDLKPEVKPEVKPEAKPEPKAQVKKKPEAKVTEMEIAPGVKVKVQVTDDVKTESKPPAEPEPKP